MKAKQIAITLQQIVETRHSQSFDNPGFEGPKTIVEKLPAKYQIIKLRNAVEIDWNSGGIDNLTIGTVLTGEQADAVARCKAFDVTITQ